MPVFYAVLALPTAHFPLIFAHFEQKEREKEKDKEKEERKKEPKKERSKRKRKRKERKKAINYAAGRKRPKTHLPGEIPIFLKYRCKLRLKVVK